MGALSSAILVMKGGGLGVPSCSQKWLQRGSTQEGHGHGLGHESIVPCTACLPRLHFSPQLMSTSEEVWRAEFSIQPWGCCLRQICGGALKIQGVLGEGSSRVPWCQACLPTLFPGGPQPQLVLGGMGTAFFSSEWPCYFRMGFVPSRVLSSSLLPSFPALPTRRAGW